MKGKVKTRLAATVGNKKALEIYLKLLEHTRSIVTSAAADKFIYYSDNSGEDIWCDDSFKRKIQKGANLGERMQNAFIEIFADAYQKVSIIGSDCIELTTPIIDKGFNQLDIADIVIGPATDGGYYFLAMKKQHNELFENIKWSTGEVLEQTIAICNRNQLSYSLLPVLSDVDEEADWLKASAQFSI